MARSTPAQNDRGPADLGRGPDRGDQEHEADREADENHHRVGVQLAHRAGVQSGAAHLAGTVAVPGVGSAAGDDRPEDESGSRRENHQPGREDHRLGDIGPVAVFLDRDSVLNAVPVPR